MMITHNICDGNNSRVVSARFASPHKTLASAGYHKSSKSQELLQNLIHTK